MGGNSSKHPSHSVTDRWRKRLPNCALYAPGQFSSARCPFAARDDGQRGGFAPSHGRFGEHSG